MNIYIGLYEDEDSELEPGQYPLGFRTPPIFLFDYTYPQADYPAAQLRQVLSGERSPDGLSSTVSAFVEDQAANSDFDAPNDEQWTRALHTHLLALPDLDARFETFMEWDGDVDYLADAALSAMEQVLPAWAGVDSGSNSMTGESYWLEIQPPHTPEELQAHLQAVQQTTED